MGSKQALCVPKNCVSSTLQEVYDKKQRKILTKDVTLWKGDLLMQDRATCETDPNYLQIIPYIIVRHGSHMLCYSRGKAGDENRLHAKLSIGFGGHIDTPIPPDQTLSDHIMIEGARELKEELGIDVDPYSIKVVGLIAEGETEVGRVHLGIYCICTLPPTQEIIAEEGTIDSLAILPIFDVIRKYEQMEIWSQLVIDSLATETT